MLFGTESEKKERTEGMAKENAKVLRFNSIPFSIGAYDAGWIMIRHKTRKTETNSITSESEIRFYYPAFGDVLFKIQDELLKISFEEVDGFKELMKVWAEKLSDLSLELENPRFTELVTQIINNRTDSPESKKS